MGEPARQSIPLRINPPRPIPRIQARNSGKGRVVREGKGVALLSFGTRLAEVEAAAEALTARGITPTIADARFAKPLDRDLILSRADNPRDLYRGSPADSPCTREGNVS